MVETVGGTADSLLETMTAALAAGKHLVTANKAMLAKHNARLFEVAQANGRAVGFEAAVCGAIPVIKGINECMTGDDITAVSGIMNGTSNYILSNMTKKGLSFAEALKGAQAMGYAEADPTLDINGRITSYNVCYTKLLRGTWTAGKGASRRSRPGIWCRRSPTRTFPSCVPWRW